jgi:hypothetical protein
MNGAAAPIREVDTVAVGIYPGDEPGETWTYTQADIDAIARNFELLSTGEKPLHTVNVVQTHDGIYAHGKVAALDKKGDILLTDWRDVSTDLMDRIRSYQIRKVSPEIKRDFRDRHGNVYPGPYLYRVATLGADVPRMKGMRDIQTGERIEAFADRVFKFADNPGVKMDKAQATEVLTKAGIDPAIIAGLTEPTLIAVASKWTPPAALPPVVTPPAPPVPIAQPVQTFADPAAIRDLVQKTIAEVMAPATKQLNDSLAAENAARERRAAEERQAEVRLFCDRQAEIGKLSPAENDEGAPSSRRSALLRIAAQAPVTHKFADPADPKKQIEKTELRLQMDEIEARQARKFAERVKAPNPDETTDPFAKRVQQRYKQAIERHDALAASKN